MDKCKNAHIDIRNYSNATKRTYTFLIEYSLLQFLPTHTHRKKNHPMASWLKLKCSICLQLSAMKERKMELTAGFTKSGFVSLEISALTACSANNLMVPVGCVFDRKVKTLLYMLQRYVFTFADMG